MLFLLIGGINFIARNVLYEEEHRGNRKFAMPLLEVVDVFRKSNWFVNGKDINSIAVNVTTVVIIIIFISLFYITFYLI